MMKPRPMSFDELNGAAEALLHWFKSQEIRPSDAAYLMAILIGHIMREMAKDYQDSKEGIDMLHTCMLKVAKDADDD